MQHLPQMDHVISTKLIIAVYIDSYVITFGLWAKYDIDGHYFRFTVQILVNPCKSSKEVPKSNSACIHTHNYKYQFCIYI